MSSSFTYTLRKRRIWPASSRRWGLSAGNFWSSTENNSPRLVAEQSSLPTPSVWRRRAVGICTVIDMLCLHGLGDVERVVEIAFELGEFGSNGGLGGVFAGERVGGFQAVASDAQNSGFVGFDAAFAVEFAGAADGDPARGFGEDAFGFGK